MTVIARICPNLLYVSAGLIGRPGTIQEWLSGTPREIAEQRGYYVDMRVSRQLNLAEAARGIAAARVVERLFMAEKLKLNAPPVADPYLEEE
jgi:hypothetical protein